MAPCRRRGALPRSRRDQCPCPRNEGPHDQGSLRRPVRFAGRSARSGRRVLLPSTFHLSRRLAFPIFSLRQKTLVRSLSALLARPLRRSCHGVGTRCTLLVSVGVTSAGTGALALELADGSS